MRFTALVLAGSRPEIDPLAGVEGAPHKALIELGGRPLLARVVAALRDAGADRIVVCCDAGPVAALAAALDAERMPTAPGPSASVAAGLEHCGTPMLVTTSDHALLEGSWVQTLIANTPAECDLSVMFARRSDVERAMPGSKRTYLKFADGEWSGCNLFWLQRPAAVRAIETWQGLEADRKRPWRIAARLGLTSLLAMVLGRLTLQGGLDRIGRRIGVKATYVQAPNGLAAVDVDTPRDLREIRELLARSR